MLLTSVKQFLLSLSPATLSACTSIQALAPSSSTSNQLLPATHYLSHCWHNHHATMQDAALHAWRSKPLCKAIKVQWEVSTEHPTHQPPSPRWEGLHCTAATAAISHMQCLLPGCPQGGTVGGTVIRPTMAQTDNKILVVRRKAPPRIIPAERAVQYSRHAMTSSIMGSELFTGMPERARGIHPKEPHYFHQCLAGSVHPSLDPNTHSHFHVCKMPLQQR